MRTRASAGAICLLLLAGCTTTGTTRLHSSQTPAADRLALVGVTCRFTDVTFKGRDYPIPPALHGRVRLAGNRTFTMNDSVNTERGRWVDTPDGFRVTEWGGSDVGMPPFHPDAANPSPQALLSHALTTLRTADDVAVSAADAGVAMTVNDFTLRCATAT